MEFKKFKKSQAALEFLTTYGWAFLVILLMVGALAYFGILSPGRLLPNRCNFGAEFQCLDFQIKKAVPDEFKLRLKNGVGQLIDVQSMTITREDGTAYPAACAVAPVMPFNGFKSAQIQDFTFTGVGCVLSDQAAGEKGKVLVTMRYSAAGSTTFVREVRGEVFAAAIT